MNFPFEIHTVLETLVNKTLVLSANVQNSNEFKTIRDVILLPNGKIEGNTGKWDVCGGVLRLLSDDGHLITEFRTLETRNNCVYAVGRNVLEPDGVSPRPILHIKKTISTNFGVCISSHTNYEDIAVPRILRSLEGDGFDMSKVVVVIGNDAKNNHSVGIDPKTHVMTVRERNDIFGMTALGNASKNYNVPYWLILHDTCEVSNGFSENIANFDVGLNPDMVILRPLDEKVEMGLYESKFALALENMPSGTRPFDYFDIATKRANVVSVLNIPFKKEPERDVYGKGIKRETVNFKDLGLKKYRAKQADIRKP